ncbi:DICT sensory domain-containing protein [Halobaculum sp. P14]|uniref:DICT sensory domain-containing protein n=1 Tax=Halobaculum sp. P14 TaxID=3421638 RepID=UPI003EBACE5F
MALRDVIRDMESREKRLTVFDPDSSAVVDDLRDYFASQQVDVVVGSTDSDLSGYAVLSDDAGDVLTAVDLDRLDGDATAGVGEPRPFSPLLEHLDDTTFSSYSIDQMVAASREIEDRAWRVGSGQLHAGFQTATALSRQADVYETLAKKPLDIHVYCAPSTESPGIDNVSVHEADTAELREVWFVVFDGGGDLSNACALLAEECPGEDRRFSGFWTYDSLLIRDALEHLHERYLTAA